ncbi:hypothetical protein KQI61_02980 [Anaerocolumna aminovalerica]|uniref:hypothetical protein n=1 Tax=Anaerocolumna aminovalerica TaxID=1527 RepID=UPI001C0F2DAC|nr:hypothetical protein [Anaerocolumna aminovalerica]MBU5331146.1 hypothetical protein [Anaerocolumna aminovalerica]
MKKILAVIGFILLFSIKQQVVYAGTLNEYETEVIRAARGQFESRGITYEVDSVYVDELIRYLMQDDIDITAEQRDKAISIMFDNVEQGVEAGYLIPVERENSTEADINIGESGNLEGTGDFADSQHTNKIEEELNGADVSTSNITRDRVEFVDQIINGSEKTTKIDTDKGKITVTSDDNNNLITVNTVIKNTGFNLNGTLFMMTILMILMVLCVVVAIQLRLFVHEEEKYKYEK